jgi:hypothetical protein
MMVIDARAFERGTSSTRCSTLSDIVDWAGAFRRRRGQHRYKNENHFVQTQRNTKKLFMIVNRVLTVTASAFELTRPSERR